MKLLDIPLGLLINFNVEKLTDGVSRLILPGANCPIDSLPLRCLRSPVECASTLPPPCPPLPAPCKLIGLPRFPKQNLLV